MTTGRSEFEIRRRLGIEVKTNFNLYKTYYFILFGIVSMMDGIPAFTPLAAGADVWFARAEATGDGSSAISPTGSSARLEAATRRGDVILLLPGEGPFDGGLALKEGQTLIGVAERGRKPSISNSDSGRHGGNGVILADDCRVIDVRVERTRASGVLGVDVTGNSLIGVEVEGSNQSGGVTTTEIGLLGRVSHGGILFIAARPGKHLENRLIRCTVGKAAGLGIGTLALKGGRSRLAIGHTHVEGGILVPPLYDMGVMALADGKGSESCLDVVDSVVAGRMSQQGRNVLSFAQGGALVKTRIERSTSGESGQDGVIGVVAAGPAAVAIEVRDSTLERAAQMNLEGSILDLAPSDPAMARESLVSIDVERSVVRDAGFVDGFRNEAQNIWIAPSILRKGPFARGRYRLTMRDSTVEGARKGGIMVGNVGADFGIAPDEGEYEVQLVNRTIRNNGSFEVAIAASVARVDARRNYWGVPGGLAEDRVILQENAKRSQLDASGPLTRPADRRFP